MVYEGFHDESLRGEWSGGQAHDAQIVDYY